MSIRNFVQKSRADAGGVRYHVTAAADKILKQGFKPKKGGGVGGVSNQENRVYTSRDHVYAQKMRDHMNELERIRTSKKPIEAAAKYVGKGVADYALQHTVPMYERSEGRPLTDVEKGIVIAINGPGNKFPEMLPSSFFRDDAKRKFEILGVNIADGEKKGESDLFGGEEVWDGNTVHPTGVVKGIRFVMKSKHYLSAKEAAEYLVSAVREDCTPQEAWSNIEKRVDLDSGESFDFINWMKKLGRKSWISYLSPKAIEYIESNWEEGSPSPFEAPVKKGIRNFLSADVLKSEGNGDHWVTVPSKKTAPDTGKRRHVLIDHAGNIVGGDVPKHLQGKPIGDKSTWEKASHKHTIIPGRRSVAITERGTRVPTRYAVVDAGEIHASHDKDLKVNPHYTSELQPRNRSRAASEEQVNRIVNKLEPEFLGESPKTSEGAPIIGHDMMVESGNGRIIALQRAYHQNAAKISEYKQWLHENADRFGIEANDIKHMKNPVLVRINEGNLDKEARQRFVHESNESSVAAMSATEQAEADSKHISGGMMNLFHPSADGDIFTPENREFIQNFMAKVVGPSERGRYIDSKGEMNQEGANRIKNAIFAKAYGDTRAIEKLAESTDNNVRNITSAMLIAAPKLADMRDRIKQGELHDLDITSDIAASMNKLSELRDQGESVSMYLNTKNFFGDELSDIGKDLLHFFDGNKRSRKRMVEVLDNYATAVERAGNPSQVSLFGDDPPTKAEVFEAAIRKADKDDGQTSLFAS